MDRGDAQGNGEVTFSGTGQDDDILLINGLLKPSFITSITPAMESRYRWLAASITAVKRISSLSSLMGVEH